jgi:hypothetical protein
MILLAVSAATMDRTWSDGQAISNDCTACHNLLAVQEENPKILVDLGLQWEFEDLDHGAVRMNVGADVQYAFTRASPGHFFKNYGGVLKVDDRSAHNHETTVGSLHHISCRRIDPC